MRSSSDTFSVRSPGGGAADLRVKLLWLSVFRMVATSLLLALLAIRLLTAHRPDLSSEDSLSFLVIGAVYLMSLIYALLLRQSEVPARAAWIQLFGDVLVATSLVYLTGGADSPFAFTYLLATVAGAILLYQRGAILTALASTGAFGALILALQFGLLKMPAGGTTLSLPRMLFVLGSNTLAQFLIAALAGYLSRQLIATGGRLTAREQDLKRLAAFQNQILAAMPSGLLTCDPGGVITYINRAAETILGREPGTARGLELDVLMPGARQRAESTLRRQALEVETPKGRRILGLTLAGLEPGVGALLIVFQDLTEIRRLEEELQRVDRLAAVGRLAAQLAHEIRNPLAAMRGSAQMLAERPTPEVVPRLSGILVREADRLSGLLEDFLKFARPPEPTLRACSLRQIVVETVEMLQGDPIAREVRLETDAADTRANVDPDQVRQVLINLVRNALSAAGPGGRVRVSLTGDAHRVAIRVWDSAGSIPPSDLVRVFEPFYTTRRGGTGLGLSTAHSIVRAHGGTIDVKSSPQMGTEFVVELPQSGEGVRADSGR